MAAPNYFKNVIKSIAYTAADVGKELAPDAVEFAKSNMDFVQETYASIKLPPMQSRRRMQAFQSTKLFKTVDTGFKNIKEDLTTGDFYAKQRADKEYAKLLGFDFDFDDNGFDFNFDSETTDASSLEVRKSTEKNSMTKGDAKIVQAIEGTSAASAQSTIRAIVATSDNNIQNIRANTAMLYEQNERLFGNMHKDLSVIGATLDSIFKLQTSVISNIDKNISSFQTESLRLDTERNAILKEMLELQKSKNKTAQELEAERASKSYRKNKKFSDFSIGGMIDFDGYFNYVKENIKNEMSTYTMGMGMTDLLSTMMVAPTRDAMKMIGKTLIPKVVKTSMESLNESIGGLFGNIINKINSAGNSNNMIVDTLSRIFGIKSNVNRRISTSQYEKGAVAWDGIARKSLITVIPEHLRRIETILSGQQAQTFDYDTGKWISITQGKSIKQNIRTRAVQSATYDIINDMNKTLNIHAPADAVKRAEYDRAIDEFRNYLYDRDGVFYVRNTNNRLVTASENGITKDNYPMLYKYYSQILKAYKDFDLIDKIDKNGNVVGKRHLYGRKNSLASRIKEAKETEDRQYRELESSGHSAVTKYYEYDSKIKGLNVDTKLGILGARDKYGQTIHSYLHNINQELMYLRLYGVKGGSGNTNISGNDVFNQIQSNINENNFRALSDKLYTQRQLEINAQNANNQNNNLNAYGNDRRSAFEKVLSGRVTDLRDLTYSERKYLLELSKLTSADLKGIYQEQMNMPLDPKTDKVLGQFFSTQFKKARIRTIDDIDRAITKAIANGGHTYDSLTSGSDNSGSSFKDKIVNRYNKGRDYLNNLLHSPGETLSNIIATADKAIYDMFFKLRVDSDGDRYKGFLDFLVGKTSSLLSKLKDSLFEKLIDPIRAKLNLEDGFGAKTKTAFKELFNIGKTAIGNTARNIGSDTIDFFTLARYGGIEGIANMNTDQFNNLSNSAKRSYRRSLSKHSTLEKQVNKAGFRGGVQEKILRLQELGVEQDKINKILQYGKSEEEINHALNKVYYRLNLRKHARGTLGGYVGNTMLSRGELLFNRSGVSMINKTGAYRVSTPTDILNSEDSYDLLSYLGYKPKFGRKSVITAQREERNKQRELLGHADGTFSLKDIFNRKGSSDDAKALIKEGKKYLPDVVAGAGVGGIASLLLGVVGGPLLGAAVGSGLNLLRKSDAVQNIFLGTKDDEGKRLDNGIISKAVQDTVKKYAPTIGKGSLLGLATSLITPLGPVGGLLIGGAVGFLKENEEVREKLFGKLSINTSEKDIISKLLPNTLKGAGLGAVSGLFLGPFGIMGNAAIGAAIGMATSTDEFKDLVFGKMINGERFGGMIGALKDAFSPIKEAGIEFKDRIFSALQDNIIQPLANFVQPAIHALPQIAGWLPRKLADRISQEFKIGLDQILKHVLVDPIKKLMNPLARFAGNMFRFVTIPFRSIGVAGNLIRRKQLNTMNADYMTAAQRMNWRKKLNMDASAEDAFFASIGSTDEQGNPIFSIDQAKDLRSDLTSMLDTRRSVAKDRKSSVNEVYKVLKSYKTVNGKKISHSTINDIIKAINEDRTQDIPQILSMGGLDDGEIRTLMDSGKYALRKKIGTYLDLNERQRKVYNLTEGDRDKAKSKVEEIFKKQGLGDIDLTKSSEIKKFIKYLDTEIDSKEKSESTKGILTDTNKDVEDILGFVEKISKAVNIIAGIGDDEINENVKARDKAMSNATGMARERADAYQKATKNKLGQEVWDQMLPSEQSSFRAGNNKVGSNRMTQAEKKAATTYGIVNEITKKRILYEPEAKEYISKRLSFKSKKYKRLIKFLKNKYIGAIISNGGPISLADLQQYIDIAFYNESLNTAKKKAEYVVTRNLMGRYPTISSVMNITALDHYQHSVDYVNGEDITQTNEPAEDQHGIGTLLAGSVLKSLFGKKKKDSERSGISPLSKIGGSLSAIFSPNKPSTNVSTSDTNEVDIPGDGRDVAAIGDGFGLIKRNSDGSVEPDTSDSHTKQLVNEQNKRQTLLEKLQNAQLKASDAISKALEAGSVVKEKGKKGLGWLAALLLGGALVKSGIAQKLFDGVIKPIWTDHIKPWVTDTALPFLKDEVLKPAGDWILNIGLPTAGKWILNEGIPTIAGLIADGIGYLIKNLPRVIANGIKRFLGIADEIVNNPKNVGAKTKINPTGKTGMSGLVDGNGNALTWEDISSGNYDTLYNAEGVKGTVNKKGEVVFKDASMAGSSYASVVGNAAAHSFASPIGGIAGAAINKPFSAVGNYFSKKGIVGKYVGGLFKTTGAAISKPISATSSLFSRMTERGKNLVNFRDKAIFDSRFTETPINADIYATTNANRISEARKSAKADNKLITRLANKAKGIVTSLLEQPRVSALIEKVASTKAGAVIGKGAATASNAVPAMKKAIINIFDDIILKGSAKVGGKVVKQALRHLGPIVTGAFLVIDFLKGCDQAESIFGVEQTGPGEELCAGLINALGNLLIIPAIWPGIPALAQKLHETIGGGEDYQQRVAEANKAYNEYIESTGSTLTKEEYLARQHSLTGKIGGKIADGWQGLKNKFGNLKNKIGSGFKDVPREALKAKAGVVNPIGALIDKFTNKSDKDIDDPNNNSIPGKIYKMVMFIPNKIKDIKDSIKKKFKEIVGNFGEKTEEEKKTDKDIDDGKISVFSADYWLSALPKDGASTGEILGSIGKTLNRVMSAPILIVKEAINSLIQGVKNIGVWLADKFGVFGSFFTDPLEFIYRSITGQDDVSEYGSNYINQSGKFATSGTSASTTTLKAALNKNTGTNTTVRRSIGKNVNTSKTNRSTGSNSKTSIRGFFSNAWSGVKSLFGLGNGPMYYDIPGSHYSKQIDPEIANIRFNSVADRSYQTIGDSACGPAAAVNVMESIYGKGNPVADAASFALSHGYKETDGGTKPEFFTDYFARNGVGSDISYNRQQIQNRINAGLPTVLMGSDSRGTSNSHPFGKNPHYVTVTGVDSRGNAVVQDPESRYSNQVYKVNDLVRKTTLGVSAFGRSRYTRHSSSGRGAFGRGRYGRGKSKMILLGDSKTVGMYISVYGGGNKNELSGVTDKDGNIWICKVGAGYSYAASHMSTINNKASSEYAVVIIMGVNDIMQGTDGPANSYATLITNNAKNWTAKGAEVYYISIPPIDGVYSNRYGKITNEKIDAFNSKLRSGLGSNVKYIDINSQLKGNVNCPTDHLHYDGATYKKVYELIRQSVGAGAGVAGGATSGTTTVSSGNTAVTTTASPGVDTRNMLLFEAHYMKDDGKLPDYTGKHVVTSNINPNGTIGDLSSGDSITETGTGSFRFGAGKYGIGLYKSIYGGSKYGMGDIENQDLCVWADVTVEEIDNYLSKKGKGTPFEGKGSVFLSIAQSTGFDPAYLIAHSAIESAWGKSNFARNRGNYFGIGAVDTNPNKAYTMSSSSGDFHPDGLLAGAQWIKKNYYDRGQTTLYLFNHGKSGHAYRTSSFAPEIGLMKAFYNSISGYDSRPKSKHNGDGSSVVVSDSTGSTGTTSGATAVATATAGDSRNMLLFEAKYLKDTEGFNNYTGYRVIQSNLPTDDLTGVTLPKIAKTVASTPITVANTESIIDTDTRSITTNDGQVIETSGITEADLADFEAEVKASTPTKSTSNNASKKTKSTSTGNYAYDYITRALSEVPKKDKKYPDVLFGHGKRRRGIFGRFKNVNQNLMSLTNRFLGESAEGALRKMVKPSKYGRAKSSIGEFLSNVVANSAAAQVFNSFLDFGVSSYDDAEEAGTIQAVTSGNTANNGVTGSGDALNMVKIAQQEEALTDGSNKENPKGSNSVKYNDWYYGKHVSGSAYPWCAAFVAWVANQAGVPTDILPKSASTRETYANVKKHGGSYPQKSEAQPGDLAFYTNSSGSPSGISHIGIVEKLEGGQIYTIEGNTTDAVHRRHFNVSDSSKLIARPAYRAAQAQESVTRGNGGKFPTYALNDAQLKGVANILQHEQPGAAGMQAEASLMANLTDIKGDEYATVDNLVSKATSGWFAKGSSRFNNPGNPSATAIDAAKKVLVQGRRTMPRYINEHDYIGDIASISTGNKNNKSDYHPHETVIQQAKSVGGGTWIYYTHPGPNTDPFGYTSKENRTKWGEDHFNASGGNGYKPRSMYGRAKYGMGNRAAEVWNWFTSHGYSDAATAGILGNMQQESGVDPEVIQGGGRGPAAGIVQWENYNTKSARWKSMADHAKSKGKSWTDLESQLEYVDKENANPGAVYWKNATTYKSYDAFKQATDIDAATLDFEKAFERAGKPAMANRYKAAHKYYEQFNGTGGTAISSSSTGDSSGTAATVTAGPSMSSIGQWLSNVLANSAAGQVLNSFLDFGGGGTTVVQDTSATTDTSSSEEGSVEGSSDFIPAGNSKLATVSLIAPYSRPRTHAVDTITIHTMAGPMGAKRCCQYFAYERKNASSNYCIGGDGTIALCVEEKNRAFTSSSTENDNRAITFEVSSITTTEPFKCTDAAYEAIIKLCVDICQRYGKTKMIWIPSKAETMSHKYASNEMRMTIHKWFKNKACPGQYLESHMGDIANQVNARLAAAGTKPTSNVTIESIQTQLNGQIASGFTSGSGGNGFKPRSLYGMFTGVDSLTEKDMKVIDSFHSGNIDNSTYGTGNMMPKTEADRSTISAYRRYKDRMYDYGTGKGRSSANKYRTINIKNKLPRPKIAAGEPEANGFDPIHDSKEIRALNTAYQKLHYGRGKSDISHTSPPVYNPNREVNLLKEIVNILVKVAMNTDKLNTIVKILNTKLNINISAEEISNAQQGDLTSERLATALANSNNPQLNKFNTYADTVNDASIYNIINAMNAIASE